MFLTQLGQSNSEHSRHWCFGGKIYIDDEPQAETLFQMVKSTLPATGTNSVIAFHDNSSALYGCNVEGLVPEDPVTASPMCMQRRLLHPILTAETHNFPTYDFLTISTESWFKAFYFDFYFIFPLLIFAGGWRHLREQRLVLEGGCATCRRQAGEHSP